MSWYRVVLAIAAALSVSASTAAAQPDAGPSIRDLQIGFGGAYKVGHRTPLSLTVRASPDHAASGNAFVQLDDDDGIGTTFRESGISAPAGEDVIVPMLVKPGRPHGPIQATFATEMGAARRVFAQDGFRAALLATQELLVEVGGSIGLQRLQQLYSPTSLERPQAALIKDLRTLPSQRLGYDGVDVVVVTTGDPALNKSWSGNEQIVQALEEWVRLGGKLILCVGREGERVLADGAPLARFAPGAFDRIEERDPGPWESFAGAATQPMLTPDGRKPSITTTVLRDVRGIRLSDENLVIRSPYGFGEVLFVAADLERPPFTQWPAQTKLLLRLLGRSELLVTQSVAEDVGAQRIRLGYTGLAGQLRAALGQFAGATVVPFWLVFFLALCYAAAVFPLEYMIARWLRPRFEAAWLLLPLVLLAGAGVVWYLAVAWKGDDILLNKVEVTDVDLSSGTIRGHMWLGLYSPRTDSYDVEVSASSREPPAIKKTQVSWFGLPGTGLGGMNSQIVAAEQFDRGYTFGESGQLLDVPLTAWSSKAFEASWDAAALPSSGKLGQRSADPQPLGALKNETGRTLRDCVLFYERRSYPLGTLAPGQTIDVGRIQSVLTVNSFLIGRRRTGDKDQATPYQPEGTDLSRIVQAILFHDAAGGRQYTSLANRIYHRLDLSAQLSLGRAVLSAAGPPVTRAAIDADRGGEPTVEKEMAFYRFVIPVDRSGASDNSQPTIELRLD
jgi:hypothetical protein